MISNPVREVSVTKMTQFYLYLPALRHLCLEIAYLLFLVKRGVSFDPFIGSPAVSSERVFPSALSTSLFNLLTLQEMHKCAMPGVRNPPTVVIYEEAMWSLAINFQESASRIRPGAAFLDIQFTPQMTKQSITNAITVLEKYTRGLHTVGIFLQDRSLLHQFMQGICATVSFKWTHLLHTTEWILASTHRELGLNLNDVKFCPDFFTVMVFSEGHQVLAHKTRGMNALSVVEKDSECAETVEELANNFKDLASSKLCGIQGMHLPVAFLSGVRKYTDVVSEGNTTEYDGYSVALTAVMARAMQFTYELVMPTDNGDYGAVDEDGTANGVTGLLARREAAFSNMGLSKTDDRVKVIDYVDSPILYEPVQVTYKLPRREGELDRTLIDIVQLELIYSLIGPCLGMVFLGLLVHFLTRSCTEVVPRYSLQEVRKLGSFPSHVCFHTTNVYAGQTGRILRGTWGIFCVIMIAAYSAYLVTTFTVKTKELKIDSAEKLLQMSDTYKFGVWEPNSALMTLLQTSKDDYIQEMWAKLQSSNKTDQRVMSGNMTDHVAHTLKGQYAFVDHLRKDDIPLYLADANISEVRSYILHSFDSLADGFLTLPMYAFFKDEFNIAVMKLEAAGVLRFLREKYDIVESDDFKSSTVQKKTSVAVSRIAIVIYVTVGGAVLSILSLLSEIIVFKLNIPNIWDILHIKPYSGTPK